MDNEWQNNFSTIKDRGHFLRNSTTLSDCRFLVGTFPKQRLILGHRFLLVTASPVFDRMFNGAIPMDDRPIEIPDVQPDAFEIMLDYIYTDKIYTLTHDNASQLFYLAKKYMLPHVVEHCTTFLISELSPKNACLTFQLGTLFEDPRLMESSMEYITSNTMSVINDPSFMDIEMSTLITIFDQNYLNINTEMDLFICLLKYANKRGFYILRDKDNNAVEAASKNTSELMENIERSRAELRALRSATASSSAGARAGVPNASELPKKVVDKIDAQPTENEETMFQQAVKKIRFLTMGPQTFAEGPAKSKLLKEDDALAILIYLLYPNVDDCQMPEGFCQLGKRIREVSKKKKKNIRYYCLSPTQTVDTINKNLGSNETSLLFQVDKSMYLVSVRLHVKTQKTKFTACIENMHQLEVGSANSITKVGDSMYELTFEVPVFIYCNQTYTVKIRNIHGICVQASLWDRKMVCEGITFNIIPLYRSMDLRRNQLASPISGLVFSFHDFHASCFFK